MYNELLEGRIKITKVVRMDHKDDGQKVGNKIFDYSYATIEKLMKDGYHDASIQMGIELIKYEFLNLNDKFLLLKSKEEKNENYKNAIGTIRKDIQQIQNTAKIKNGHDGTTIMTKVNKLLSEASTISDMVNHETLKEEKVLLVDAAKQFQETIQMIKKIVYNPRYPYHNNSLMVYCVWSIY